MSTLPQHMTITEQQSLRNNLSRAKSLLKRNETLRALDALIDGLSIYDPQKLPGKVRFEIDTILIDCAKDLACQPLVRDFFNRLLQSSGTAIAYTAGKPDVLKKALEILRKGLQGELSAQEEQEKESKEARKTSLAERGLSYLKAGETPKGKSALRLLADEFGHEPGVYTQVGTWLCEAGLLLDAVDFLEEAIENFPKESKAYAEAANAYTRMQEYEKAVSVYMKAVKQFGKHPRTLLNLAKVYAQWNKRDKAFEFALEAYTKDPSMEEAKAIVDRFS